MCIRDRKYECFLEFYVTSEGRFNRNLVRWAKKYRPTDYLIDLPGEYIDKSTLEVYRASTLPPEYEFLIQNEPAWTLKKRVAEWFRDRAKLISVSRYIYKATINKDDIVAYTNCRKEYEVVQLSLIHICYHFRHLTVYRPLSGGLSAARLVRQHG